MVDDDTVKEALKEALKEWLDEKFAAVGKWTLSTAIALGLSGFVYFVLWSQGYHK